MLGSTVQTKLVVEISRAVTSTGSQTRGKRTGTIRVAYLARHVPADEVRLGLERGELGR